jgi:hypothetical protein
MSTKIEDGGPAFPSVLYKHYPVENSASDGMSLRDWFAGQFLAGAAADNSALDVSVAADQFDIDVALRDYWAKVGRAAYIAADALIAARSQTEGSSHA